MFKKKFSKNKQLYDVNLKNLLGGVLLTFFAYFHVSQVSAKAKLSFSKLFELA